MVDARVVHTMAALRAAILRLAADRPVSKITVADVTRAAGINRATFYAHAISPGSLLADVLTPELDRIRAEDLLARKTHESDAAATTNAGIQAVINHIVKYRDIYEKGLQDRNDASLQRLLVDHFRVTSREHLNTLTLDQRPKLVDDVSASFIAQGLVGAITAWLSGPRRSQRALVDTIVGTFPAWWR